MEWECKKRHFEVDKNMQENNIKKRHRPENTETEDQEPCQDKKLST